MKVKRLDHINVVVEDLPQAVTFFTTLGLTVEGQMPIEGDWVDRVNGIKGIKVDVVTMVTPDGHSKIEFVKFHNPQLVNVTPEVRPPNALGLQSIMFAVDSVDDAVSKLSAIGGELMGEIVNYENMYRLCYMRGPAGIIIALAEELF